MHALIMHSFTVVFLEGITDMDLKISRNTVIDKSAMLFKYHITMGSIHKETKFVSLWIQHSLNCNYHLTINGYQQ